MKKINCDFFFSLAALREAARRLSPTDTVHNYTLLGTIHRSSRASNARFFCYGALLFRVIVQEYSKWERKRKPESRKTSLVSVKTTLMDLCRVCSPPIRLLGVRLGNSAKCIYDRHMRRLTMPRPAFLLAEA